MWCMLLATQRPIGWAPWRTPYKKILVRFGSLQPGLMTAWVLPGRPEPIPCYVGLGNFAVWASTENGWWMLMFRVPHTRRTGEVGGHVYIYIYVYIHVYLQARASTAYLKKLGWDICFHLRHHCGDKG